MKFNLKRVQLSIFLLLALFSIDAFSQTNLQNKIALFPWSRMVSETNGVEIKRTKPTPGYVEFKDGSRRFGVIKLKTADGQLSKVEIQEGKKFKAVTLEDVTDLGVLGSPKSMSEEGRIMSSDSIQNFQPVELTKKDGSKVQGYAKYLNAIGDKPDILFSSDLNTPVQMISGYSTIKASSNQELYFALNQLIANERVKYGILSGNGLQVAFDGENRKGLRMKPFSQSYDKAEHHLYEASKAFYKGNKGYAGFMLGKGILEYLIPLNEAETDFSFGTKVLRQQREGDPQGTGFFVINTVDGLDKSNFKTSDYWVLMDYLNTYALYFQTRGKHAMARDIYEYILTEGPKYLSANAEVLIAVRHNYALLQADLGDFIKAINLMKDALDDILSIKGKKSRVYSVALNNRGMLLARMGQLTTAMEILDEAISIGTFTLPEYGIDSERLLINKSLLNHQLKNYDGAQKGYLEASDKIAQKEKSKLSDHDQASLLYGEVLLDKFDPNSDSEGNLFAVLEGITSSIIKKYPDQHSLNGQALMLQGKYHLLIKDYTEARNFFTKANENHKLTLGTKSYNYLKSKSLLSISEWKLGLKSDAFNNMIEVSNTYLELKDALFSTMSENQRAEFWNNVKPHLDVFSLFAANHSDSNPEWAKEAFDFRLKTKGILFSASSNMIKLAMNSQDPEVREKFDKWVQLRESLLNGYNEDVSDREDNAPTVEELLEQINSVEQQLAASIDMETGSETDVAFPDIQGRLNTNEALIEIVKISPDRYIEPNPLYFAFIVKSNQSNPLVVPLKNGSELEQKFYKKYLNSIYFKIEDESSIVNYWEPIAAELSGISKVYIVNDGIYNQINLAGLRSKGSDDFLGDKTELAYLTIPSNLIFLKDNNQTNSGSDNSKVFLLGGPEFGSDKISPLPGAEQEIKDVDEILKAKGIQTEIHTTKEASESNLRSMEKGNDVLHIATHGYFTKSENIGGPLMSISKRPDFKSGLILAGASTENPQYAGQDDGYFPAYEALHLNLSETELVVLSACETGKGEVVAGESVQGLARSFRVAGSQRVIMSLWKVNDEATRQLMTTFYQKWTDGLSFDEAFVASQRELRAQEQFSHPYFWSAFVLLN